MYGPIDPTVGAPAGRPRRRLRWPGRILVLLFAAGAAAGVAGGVLAWTSAGQELALQAGLRWLNARLLGELSVAGIRSSSPLRGAVLEGVRVDAEGGSPVLLADSLEVRYSLRGLVRGRQRLASLTLWGLAVRIAPLEAGGALNVQRVLADAGEGPDGAQGSPVLRIDRLIVRDGLLEVLRGSGDDGDGSDGDDDRRGRIALEDLELELDDLLVRSGGEEVAAAEVRAFSTNLALLEEPIRVSEGQGSLTFGAHGVRLADGTFALGRSGLAGTVQVGPEEAGGAWRFRADVDTRGSARLADFAWIDPRLPSGSFRGGALVRVGNGVDARLRSLVVQLDDSRVSFDGGVTLDEEMSVTALEVDAAPLALEES